MELERLSVALRSRNAWEAIDLGIRLAVRHARPLYAAWFAVTLPVFVLLLLVLGQNHIDWLCTIMWWLKPAFDRVAVHVISHTVFGETPSVRSTLRALPRLLLSSQLFAALTWRRFSLLRSITLPVDVLEGLRGRAARQRKTLLARRIGAAARWQTFIWLHLEFVLWLGLLGLLAMLVPSRLWPSASGFFTLLSQMPVEIAVLINVSLALCSLLLEPLYVAGGFMLYIKRRTDLEAWDVELQLRRLARSQATKTSQALATRFVSLLFGMVLGMTLLSGLILPQNAHAATSAELRETAIEQADAHLDAVLQDPAFGTEEKSHTLRWRKDDKHAPEATSALPAWLQSMFASIADAAKWLGALLAWLGRVGGWALLVLVVAGVLFLVSRTNWMRGGSRRAPPPSDLAGFDIRPQSLPANITQAALDLLHAGDGRAALSLLFRGSLSRLAHEAHVPFCRGDTEGDCLTRTHQHARPRAHYLARLLGTWQRLAYAHQSIAPREIEILCQDWQGEFGGGAHD